MKKLGVILLVIVFASCKNESDPEADKSFFTKFYDDNAFNIRYVPLDAVQTADGGYLVLAVNNAADTAGVDVKPRSIFIMKTDEFGDFKSKQDVDPKFVLPAPNLVELNGKFYFFCMDLGTFGTQLIEVNSDGTIAAATSLQGSYPLAAGTDGTSLMLLSYDPGESETVMSTFETNGTFKLSKGFSVGPADGQTSPGAWVLESVLGTGTQLPFFVGKVDGGLYYFNGIYNYTLSTLFTDLTADNPSMVIQGNQNRGGMSALYPIAGGKFAAARFNYGDNYISPTTTLANSAANIEGFLMSEFTPNAPVKIIGATINGQQRILYGANTRGKQIALYGYDLTGKLVGTKYIGFSNSFELASMKPTADGGLVVLGTTYIAGRFPRICLFKLSAEALSKSFQ